MNWFERFKKTPLYFKVFAILLVADILLVSVSFLPGMYERGISRLGNIWWAVILSNFFVLSQDNDRGIRGIKKFAFFIAVITTIQTILTYRNNVHAHAEFPLHPSFYFYWFHWVDGVAFPWFVALVCYLLPKESLPLRRSETLKS